MRLLLGCLLALAALPTSGIANPVFAAFDDLCIKPRNPLASIAFADARGWAQTPRPELQTFAASWAGVRFINGRTDPAAAQSETPQRRLVVGYTYQVGSLKLGADFCAIVASGSNLDSAKEQIALFASVPEVSGIADGAQTTYAWRVSEGRHAAITHLELATAKPGKARILVTYAKPEEVVIALFTPAKEP